jgi:hypothetical protein
VILPATARPACHNTVNTKEDEPANPPNTIIYYSPAVPWYNGDGGWDMDTLCGQEDLMPRSECIPPDLGFVVLEMTAVLSSPHPCLRCRAGR